MSSTTPALYDQYYKVKYHTLLTIIPVTMNVRDVTLREQIGWVQDAC